VKAHTVWVKARSGDPVRRLPQIGDSVHYDLGFGHDASPGAQGGRVVALGAERLRVDWGWVRAPYRRIWDKRVGLPRQNQWMD